MHGDGRTSFVTNYFSRVKVHSRVTFRLHQVLSEQAKGWKAAEIAEASVKNAAIDKLSPDFSTRWSWRCLGLTASDIGKVGGGNFCPVFGKVTAGHS